MTQKEKIAAYEGLKARESLLDIAINDILSGDIVWSKWISEDGGGKYRVGHVGTWRHDNGEFLVVYRYPGQRDQTDCRPWDETVRLVMNPGYISTWGSIIRECVYDLQRREIAA